MKMLQSSINKKLLPMKSHYFLFNAGTAPVVPFMPTYARQLGFSSVIVGIIYTVLPIAGMIAKPIMGAIADKFHAQKSIFLIMQLIIAAAFLGINYIPEIPSTRVIKFSCDNGEADLNTCVGNVTITDNNIIKKLETDTRIMYCDLDCPMGQGVQETICKYWNSSEYCGVNNIETLKFKAHVPISKTDFIKNCVMFKVDNVTTNDGQIHYPSCPDTKHHISSICNITCDLPEVNELLASKEMSDAEVSRLYQFWLFLILMVIGWVGQAVVVSVGDAICFELLDDNPNRYGRQRMFGALGWGLFSIISGVMLDAFSTGEKKNYVSVFYLAVAILICDFAVSYKLQYSQKKQSSGILRGVGRLLANVKIFVFLMWCVCTGLCTSLVWNFLFWLLEDLAKQQGPDSFASVKTLEGIVMSIQCLLGELPFFFLSGAILKRIGHINTMTLVLFVFGIRFILYSVIKNPWWFLPIELSNGLTFGLCYATMASYASIVAPPGTEATVQGMVGAVFEGVGVSLGSFIGGFIYNEYDGPTTFKVYGIGALIACLVHAAVQYIIVQRKSDYMARYAAPKDAIHMVTEEDQQELKLVSS